jgi:hypothetical protein
MTRHVTYRGTTIDMDTMRRENEKVPALGNMGVNAKGDKLARGGTIAKTADQIARENHRVQSSIVHTGLKGAVPASPATVIEPVKTPVKSTAKKVKETELPSGDIIIEDDKDGK